ncbi:MAG: TrkA family potassium uptake protein [Chloroflexi bacterium]|nr:MAG: TrkA family potassium uptake protein [Chloroflexota bacterium]
MYFVVAGAGEVGFHLSQALLEAGHEVTIIEADRRRANFVQDKLGSIVMNAAADEGRAQMEAGCSRADALVAVTGDDAKNLVICQLAKLNCHTPRVIARVNNPKNEIVFKTLGIDETISSTRVLMNVIEQELPSGGFMPIMPLAGTDNEMIEAEIAPGTPPAGKTIGSLRLPSGALVGGVLRRGKLMHADDDTKLEVGDRVFVFGATASESEVRKALFG